MEAQLTQKRQELTNGRTQMASLQAQIEGDKVAPPPGFTTASLNGNLRVEILQPALALTRGLDKPAASVPPSQDGMEVIGRVSAPAGLTSLSLNGQTITTDAGGVFKTRVAVTGSNTAVTVAALDKSGGKATLDFMLVPGPGGSGTGKSSAGGQLVNTLPNDVKLGKYYALVIGNDAYSAYPALKSAEGDAKAISAVLKSRYGYETHLLTNANRFEILSALNDMREQLKDNDNLLEVLCRPRRDRHFAARLLVAGRCTGQHADELDIQSRRQRYPDDDGGQARAGDRRFLLFGHDDAFFAGHIRWRHARQCLGRLGQDHGCRSLTHRAHFRWCAAGRGCCGQQRALRLRQCPAGGTQQ